MLIIPAIDIRDGKCVRLIRGDFNQEKIYENNPVVIAQKWQSQRAKALHIVDLDGAKNGKLINLKIIKEIRKKIKIPIQLGGGICNQTIINKLFSLGINKIIIGTIALENETLLKRIIKKYKDKIIVSLDAKNGKLMKNGWQKDSGKSILETALKLEKLGVNSFIYTDTLKDGTLTKPNYKEIKQLLKKIKIPLFAGGGITSISDVKKLKTLGVKGVIIGKALYEKKINLKEAINVS